MGTGRTLRKKPRTRPTKTPGERRHREKVHKARLVKLGMDAAVVAKLNSQQARELLKRPAQVKPAAKS